jgi:hypothetical protein
MAYTILHGAQVGTSMTTTTTSSMTVGISGSTNSTYTFFAEPINFGFIIRFKTTKAKLIAEWKTNDHIVGNLAIGQELKKIL